MDYRLKLKQWLPDGKVIGRTLKETFERVTAFAGFSDRGEEKQADVRRAITSLVRKLLQQNGNVSDRSKEIYRQLLCIRLEIDEAERIVRELASMEPMSFDDAVGVLKESLCEPEKRAEVCNFLLALAVELGESAPDIELVRKLALQLEMPESKFEAELQKLHEENRRRRIVISSGWGVVAAIVLIGVFILTATLLKSVIFGLLIAVVLLPLEKHFEKSISRKRGLSYLFVSAVGFIIWPLNKFSRAITRRPHQNKSGGDRQQSIRRKIIRQSVTLTVFTAILALLLLIFGLSMLTGRYMQDVQKKISDKFRTSRLSNAALIARGNYHLEQLRTRAEGHPLLHKMLLQVEKSLKDPDTQDQFFQAAIEHGGGLFSFTTSVFSAVVSFFCNLLLTLFFALLFLYQLAAAGSKKGGAKATSAYLVKTVFSGIWLPGMTEEILAETGRIIEEIFFRLKVWLKGYLTLIVIDSTFYTMALFFLGVPHFLPLGLFSGWGIALPYLGPIITCSVTFLVTFAGGGSSTLLLSILLCYLIYNGIIEQFILYPAVIGESLGLSTLETIIVVLLGAIFAGIPGMIFSLPVASVAKYIIPQIYRSFFHLKKI